MPAQSLARAAATGFLLVNAVPHGVAGLRGRPFPSPFAKPPAVGLSGPVPNLVWSAANLAAGAWLLRDRAGTRRERLVMLGSGAATAAGLTAYFRALDVSPV